MYEDDYSLHTSVVEELQNDFEEEEYLDVSGDEDGSKTNDNDQDYVFDLENNSERDSPAGPNSVVDQDEIDSLIGDAPPLIASILDGPEVWPTVTSVNLDRRLPLKFKRHEFEPLVNGVIGNLSNEYDKWTSEAESAEDTTTDIKLTHEQDTFLLQYGFHAKEEFLHLAKIVMPLYSKDPFRHIKFADLRVYAPNIDGLLLYVIYQLLIHMKLINFEVRRYAT
ncbi:hypothetical protein BC833DRAFT_392819 [Globomyces pollinis-pini]|nr:hypothetical protein BC833DRAFT_392819 [Globomyces pollinis-pini]